jgi:hypothetical protein
VTSVAVSHFLRRNTTTTRSMTAACPESSSRSSSEPCHQTVTLTRAPGAR